MTVLVTGGAGFIGCNLVRALLDDGSRVIVIDDFSTGRRERLPRSDALRVIEGDVANLPDLERLVEGCSHVFHLAAQVGVMPSADDPVRDAHSNVMGTVRLLQACRGSSVRRIVCSASAAAYGDAAVLPIPEDLPPDPASFYALSKVTAERYAELASSLLGLPTVRLRYFNVFGLPFTGSEYAGVISVFLGRLKRGVPLVIYGDGTSDRDFVYVKDVVTANLLAAERGTPGAVYNIGSGVATTVLELAHLMGDLAGRSPEIEYQPSRPGEIHHSLADLSRARDELGYRPSYDLRSGLAEIWDEAWGAV